MSDIKIDPAWFKKNDKNSTNQTISLNQSIPKIDDLINDEIASLSENDQKLFNLIMERNSNSRLSVEKMSKSFFTPRHVLVDYYVFSKALKIQTSCPTCFGLILSHNGYSLNYYNKAKNISHTICKIDSETINAIYPSKAKRVGKRLAVGMMMFCTYFIIMGLGKVMTRTAIAEASKPSREELLLKVKSEIGSYEKIDTEELITLKNELINEVITSNIQIKKLKRSQFNMNKDILQEARSEVVQYYCTDSKMKSLRDYEIAVNYRYFSSDGHLLYEASAGIEDCN
jgi:hypothetical protein